MGLTALPAPYEKRQNCRNLQDPWHLQPDWRFRVIDQYLVELAEAKDRIARLQEICDLEKDPYVRQATRFCFSGTCVHQRAIEWAFRVMQSNAANGLASRIKAAVLADRFPEEIATMLSCQRAGVVAFEKIFWDVRRFLGNELWLRSMVERAEAECSTGRVARREAYWLRIALEDGWPGLERVWFPKYGGSDEKSLGALAREIESIAARRTLRHLQHLEETQEPVSDDDIKRLAILSRLAGSRAVAEEGDRSMLDFFKEMLDVGTRNLLAGPETSKVKALEAVFAERLGVAPSASSTALVKVRKRTAQIAGGRGSAGTIGNGAPRLMGS